MKITSTILYDFVRDFQLEETELGVCFDATVNFNLPLHSFNLQSEVYMESILSHRIDSIYLLSPAVEQYKMPTFFNDVNHQFLYLKKKGVLIAGDLPAFGSYSISIIPKSRTCSQQTYDELKAKKLN